MTTRQFRARHAIWTLVLTTTLFMTGWLETLCRAETLAGREVSPDSIVATVNRETVTVKDIAREFTSKKQVISSQQKAQEFLEQIIGERLLLQDAERQGIERNKGITAQIAAYKKEKQLSLDDEVELYKEMLVLKAVKEKIWSGLKITGDEIANYYDKHKRELMVPEQVELALIKNRTKEQSDKILQRLSDGEDFDAIATELNISRKGYIGYQKKGGRSLPREIAAVAFSSGKGEVKALKHREHYDIIKVIDKRQTRQKTLSECQSDIERLLLEQERFQVLADYTSELKKKATITRNTGLLGDIVQKGQGGGCGSSAGSSSSSCGGCGGR